MGAPTISSTAASSFATGGGGTLTLTGTNFGTTSTVSVGGRACPVTSRSHTQLQCTLPAWAGANLPIVVTCALQTNAAGGAAVFSYLAPALTSISPTTADTPGAVTITLTGTNFGPSTIGGTVTVC